MNTNIFEELKEKKTFYVLVKANSRENKIEWNPEKESYVLFIKEPAEDNRANNEIIKFLKKPYRKVCQY